MVLNVEFRSTKNLGRARRDDENKTIALEEEADDDEEEDAVFYSFFEEIHCYTSMRKIQK